MKRILFTLAILTLSGCLLSPETHTTHPDYQVGPECLHEDSTTWTDTSETRHMSCTVGK